MLPDSHSTKYSFLSLLILEVIVVPKLWPRVKVNYPGLHLEKGKGSTISSTSVNKLSSNCDAKQSIHNSTFNSDSNVTIGIGKGKSNCALHHISNFVVLESLLPTGHSFFLYQQFYHQIYQEDSYSWLVEKGNGRGDSCTRINGTWDWLIDTYWKSGKQVVGSKLLISTR